MGSETERASPKRVKFTKATVAKLPIPAMGRVYWYDSGQAGLTVCVSAAGSRVFYLYKWVSGKPERVRLGSFPDLSVENARDLARRLVGDIAAGKDPMQEKRRAREVPMLKEAFQVWLESYAREHRKTWPKDERRFNSHLRRFHARRLNAIRPAEVALWHNETKQRHGLYEANRCFELMRAIYNRSKSLLRYHGPSPCEGVRKFKEESRDRFLTADELPRFFASLAQEPNPLLQGFYLLLLVTGARKSNLETMRWADIDWILQQWRIPKTKSGNVVVVPLVPMAIETLRKIQALNGGGAFVFPGRCQGHVSGVWQPWQRLLKRAGLENLRLHDLRRSLGSWQAISGASLPVIGRSLGHSSLAATAIYARLTVDPVRKSIERATAAMLEAGGVINGNIAKHTAEDRNREVPEQND
jgi:integrase